MAEVNKRNTELEERLAQAEAEAATFRERIRAAEESVQVRSTRGSAIVTQADAVQPKKALL